MREFLVKLLAAIAYEMLRVAVQLQARPNTAVNAEGPPGERERILAIIRERMSKAQGNPGASNQ